MTRSDRILTIASCILGILVPLSGCSQVPSYSNLALSEFQDLLADETKPVAATEKPTQDEHRRAEAQFAAARQLENNGETKKATKAYKRLTREFPSHANAFHRLGVLHDQTDQTDKSARFYLKAIKLAPRNAEILCDYGYSRYIQGDFSGAEQTLRQAIKLNSDLARAHNNLALVLARQGKDKRATASFRKAGFSLAEARKNLRSARAASRLSASNSSASKSKSL